MPGYQVKIENIDASIFRSEIELNKITLQTASLNPGQSGLSAEIESVKIKDIHLLKALFKKDIHIGEVDIFNSNFAGSFAFPSKGGRAKLSPLNLRIEKLFVRQLAVDIKNKTTAQTYVLKNGFLKVFAIQVKQDDTLSHGIFSHFDFGAPEFKTISPDSLYTFTAVGINYAAASKTLTADSFAVQPNYSEYGFAAQSQFETDRVDGRFNQISFHDFSAADYIKSGNLTSSFIEIGALKLHVFRDKRKEFRHIQKPTFQDMIADYPAVLNIDSIGILSGNIEYSEHAEKAIEKGSISFDEIDIKIYKITNDTIYKTEKAYLELNTNALLMGKGKVAILLKARIYDNQNTFAVNGSLLEMEATALNPILEKNAFISIISGKINAMYFSFSANDSKASGNLKLLYQDLDFDIVNKKTGETDAILDQLKSMIANIVVMESNPMPGEEVRIGIVDYERDPERFLFNYVVKSLMTGMKTSITKTNKTGKPKK